MREQTNEYFAKLDTPGSCAIHSDCSKRGDLKREISILILVLCASLSACGSSYGNGSGSPPPTPNATMQAGQWEFVATPTNAQPAYLKANLTVSGNGVSSPVFNTLLFGGNVGIPGCGNITSNYSISNNILSGSLGFPGMSTSLLTFSAATIASDGKSVSGGSYTASSGSFCNEVPSQSSGTFTGYTVAPLTGTFSGTLTGSGQPQQVTIQISQDSNFGITASGTSVQPGVTTNLAISPAGSPTDNTGGYSNVIGALVEASGTATNVNGSSAFQVSGHFNPAGTQLTIEVFGQSAAGTGTLTKQ